MTISQDLAVQVSLLEYEKILVGNMANGNRFETYVIYGPAGRGEIILNGATAHLGGKGDRLTVMSYGQFTLEQAKQHQPKVIVLDEQNRVIRPDANE